MNDIATPRVTGPLRGLKVLEIGHFIAGPFCCRMLADQGAEVIKIENPAGEPLRNWGHHSQGHSIIWSVMNRNKKMITVDMKNPDARPVLERLVRWADVVVENFRPGQMAKWGLAMENLRKINPRIILAHISGYGQDGPYRDRFSFGAIGEAVGGIRYLTGYPEETTDKPPVRTGVSLGDDLSALYATQGILAAVYERDVLGTGVGREIDIALYEGVFSLMEGILPEYGSTGVVRRPQGSAMPTAVPSDIYKSKDGAWLLIAGNSDPIFKRLCTLMGRPEMATDPRYLTNRERIAHRAEVDGAIAQWVETLDIGEVEELLHEAGVPASRAYTVEDCVNDPHFQARDMIVKIDDPLIGPTLHPGIVPRFDADGEAGSIAWSGAGIGAHTDEVLGELAFSASEIAELRQRQAI